MGAVLPILITVGAMATVMAAFWGLAVLVRRRGVAGAAVTAALASYDEAFRTTAHQSHHEIRAQAERRTPAWSPDGRWTRHRTDAAARVRARGRGRGRTRQPYAGASPRRAGRLRRALAGWAARGVGRS